jgi:hypothetical protein
MGPARISFNAEVSSHFFMGLSHMLTNLRLNCSKLFVLTTLEYSGLMTLLFIFIFNIWGHTVA